jgi:hypothetical protein
MLSQADALPWMPFSGGKQKFQLGILLLWAGRIFYYPLKLIFDPLKLIFDDVMPYYSRWILSSFAPPDDFKLALLTLELDYAKARANRNDEVGYVGHFGWDFHWFFLSMRSHMRYLFFLFQLDAIMLAKQLQKRFLDQVWHNEWA